MTDNDISKSFNSLIENMDKLLPELNQRGSELIENQQYQEAKEIISKAELVMSLQKKLEALKEEWLGLDLPPFDISPSSDEDSQLKVSPEAEKRFRSQPHTKTKDYQIPILKTLVNLRGSARRRQVFEELDKIMGGQLTEYDRNPLPSNPGITRFIRIATSTGNKMRKEGYITQGQTKGMWMITEKGKAFLKGSEDE